MGPQNGVVAGQADFDGEALPFSVS